MLLQSAGGRIFVAGGSDGRNALKTVESYDKREGFWRPMISMKYPRVGLSFVALNDRVRCFLSRRWG